MFWATLFFSQNLAMILTVAEAWTLANIFVTTLKTNRLLVMDPPYALTQPLGKTHPCDPPPKITVTSDPITNYYILKILLDLGCSNKISNSVKVSGNLL